MCVWEGRGGEEKKKGSYLRSTYRVGVLRTFETNGAVGLLGRAIFKLTYLPIYYVN